MSSKYPQQIDAFVTKRDRLTEIINGQEVVIQDGDDILASHINDLQDSIVSMQNTIGTGPQGSFLSVSDRLNTISGISQLAMPSILIYTENALQINGLNNRDLVSDFIKKFNIAILGMPTVDNVRTELSTAYYIVRNADKTSVYFRLDCASELSTELKLRNDIDVIASLGAKGVFLDNFDYSAKVTRVFQNNIIDYCHSKGLLIITSSVKPADVLSAAYAAYNNENYLPIKLRTSDAYLYKNFGITTTGFQDLTQMYTAIMGLQQYKTNLGISIFTSSHVPINDPDGQENYFYITTASMLYNIDAIYVGGPWNNNAKKKFTNMPLIGNFRADKLEVKSSADKTRYFRETGVGQIVLYRDEVSYRYDFPDLKVPGAFIDSYGLQIDSSKVRFSNFDASYIETGDINTYRMAKNVIKAIIDSPVGDLIPMSKLDQGEGGYIEDVMKKVLPVFDYQQIKATKDLYIVPANKTVIYKPVEVMSDIKILSSGSGLYAEEGYVVANTGLFKVLKTDALEATNVKIDKVLNTPTIMPTASLQILTNMLDIATKDGLNRFNMRILSGTHTTPKAYTREEVKVLPLINEFSTAGSKTPGAATYRSEWVDGNGSTIMAASFDPPVVEYSTTIKARAAFVFNLTITKVDSSCVTNVYFDSLLIGTIPNGTVSRTLSIPVRSEAEKPHGQELVIINSGQNHADPSIRLTPDITDCPEGTLNYTLSNDILRIDCYMDKTTKITGDLIQTGTIEAKNMKAGTITADSAIIADAAIKSAHIAEASIDSAHIKEAVVDSAHIKEAAIKNVHIEDASIDNAKIADASITNAKIENASIESAKIKSLHGEKIVAGSIESGKLSSSVQTTLNDVTTLKTSIKNLGDAIELKAEQSYVESFEGNVTSRIESAESKITPSAIVNTVRLSTEYMNDLGEKVNTDGAEIVSYIEQSAAEVNISAQRIGLSGDVRLTSLLDPTDYTLINGGRIATNSITAKSIDVTSLNSVMITSESAAIQNLFSNYMNSIKITAAEGSIQSLNVGTLNGQSISLRAGSYEYEMDSKGNRIKDVNGNVILFIAKYQRNANGLIQFFHGGSPISYIKVTTSNNIYSIIHPLAGTHSDATIEGLAAKLGYAVFEGKDGAFYVLSSTGTAKNTLTDTVPNLYIDERGLTSSSSTGRLVRLDKEGIRISNDNGETWVTKLNPNGLSVIDSDVVSLRADKIRAGNLLLNDMTIYASAGGNQSLNPTYDENGHIVSPGDNRLQINSQGIFLSANANGDRKIRFDKDGIWVRKTAGGQFEPVLTISSENGNTHFGLVVNDADIVNVNASKLTAGTIDAAKASLSGGDVLINGDGITVNGTTGKGIKVTTAAGNITLNRDGLQATNFKINSDGTAVFTGNITAETGTLKDLNVTGTLTAANGGGLKAGNINLTDKGFEIVGQSLIIKNASNVVNLEITPEGNLTANNGTLKTMSVSGQLTIGSGGSLVAGNTTLDTNGISIKQGSVRLGTGTYGPAGDTNYALYIDNNGNLFAKSATINGTVNATGGFFGSSANGVTIGSTGLTVTGTGTIKNSNVTIDSDSVDVYDNSATPKRMLTMGKTGTSSFGLIGYDASGNAIMTLDSNGLAITGKSGIKLGLYDTNKHYFSVDEHGSLTASKGSIAGWDIGTGAISKNSMEIASSGLITVKNANSYKVVTLGNDAAPSINIYKGDLAGTKILTLDATGLYTPSKSLEVKADGSVSVSGSITSSSGTIGGITIDANGLHSGSTLHITKNKTILFGAEANPSVILGEYTTGTYGMKINGTKPLEISQHGISSESFSLLTSTGKLSATDATLSSGTFTGNINLNGNLNMTNITIGGNTIVVKDDLGNNVVRLGKYSVNGTETSGIEINKGSINIGTTFSVDSTGKLTATAGKIANVDISSTGLKAGDVTISSSGVNVMNGSNPVITMGAIDGPTTGLMLSGQNTTLKMTSQGLVATSTASNTEVFKIDGTGATFSGTVNATAGYFGTAANGIKLNGNALEVVGSGSIKIRLADDSVPVTLSSSGLEMTAGSINLGSGKFIASASGITATAGAIAGWTIGSGSLSGGNITLDKDNNRITVISGDNSITLNGSNGKLTATNVELTGIITATSGKIGNWIIKDGSITDHATTPNMTIATDKITVSNQVVVGKYDTTNYGIKAGNTILNANGITADQGTIAGWTITKNATDWKLTAGNVTLDAKNSKITIGTNISLNNDGSAKIGNFSIETNGNITSKSGTDTLFSLGTTNSIAGWTINKDSLVGGNITLDKANNRITVIKDSNSITLDGATGKLTANNVELTGKITASSGAIGGWTVGTSVIKSTGDIITLDNTNRLITIKDNAATQVTQVEIGLYDGPGNKYGIKAGNTILNKDGIIASQGIIGGWVITSTSAQAGNITLNAAAGNEKITIGTNLSLNNDGSAKIGRFAVATDGSISSRDGANNVTFSISGTDGNGSIAGWSINKDKIFKSNIHIDATNNAIWMGADVLSNAKLRLNSDGSAKIGGLTIATTGAISATNFALNANGSAALGKFEVDATGNISSKDGSNNNLFTLGTTNSIAGWTIDKDKLSKGNINLDATNNAIWIGSALASAAVRFNSNGSAVIGKLSVATDGKLSATNFSLNADGSAVLGKFEVDASGNISSKDASNNVMFSLGTTNSIAGWTIDKDKLSKGNISLDATNQRISIGTNVVLNNNGSATLGRFSLATDGAVSIGTNFTVDASGNATFAGKVRASSGHINGNLLVGAYVSGETMPDNRLELNGTTGALNIINKIDATTSNQIVMDKDGIKVYNGITGTLDPAKVKLSIAPNGKIIAQDAEIVGNVKSNSGHFGTATNGVTIGATGLSVVGTGTITAGDTTLSAAGLTINGSGSSINLGSGNFIVTTAGALTAKSGSIAGWTISSTTLSKGAITLDSTNDAINIVKSGEATVKLGKFATNYGIYAEAVNTDSKKTIFTFDKNGLALAHDTTSIMTVGKDGSAAFAGNITATGGSFTGLVNVGANGAVKLDGVNKRIVVNTDDVVIDTNGIAIKKGSISIGSSFGVTSGGVLTASGATISGNITATSGSFTGTINAQSGSFGSANNKIQITDTGLVIGTGKIVDNAEKPNVQIDAAGLTAVKGYIGTTIIDEKGITAGDTFITNDGINVVGRESIKVDDGSLVIRNDIKSNVMSIGKDSKGFYGIRAYGMIRQSSAEVSTSMSGEGTQRTYNVVANKKRVNKLVLSMQFDYSSVEYSPQELIFNNEFEYGDCQWVLHERATATIGRMTLNATAIGQESYQIVNAHPHNMYRLESEASKNAMIKAVFLNNDVELGSQFVYASDYIIFKSPAGCNKIKIVLTSTATGVTNFYKVSLQRYEGADNDPHIVRIANSFNMTEGEPIRITNDGLTIDIRVNTEYFKYNYALSGNKKMGTLPIKALIGGIENTEVSISPQGNGYVFQYDISGTEPYTNIKGAKAEESYVPEIEATSFKVRYTMCGRRRARR